MKEKIKTYIDNFNLLKFLANKYVIVLFFFIAWMLFLDNNSYLAQRDLNSQIEELENNKNYYKQEIIKDSLSIKNLKNPAQIEKYAREKYFMKRDSEDIYIIDYEEDNIRKKDSLAKLE